MTPPTASGRAYDPGRLRRAALRAVKRFDRYHFRVEGRHETHYDVNLALDPPCDCADAQFHGRGCLHELAARLHAGDGPLILALGRMLADAEKRSRSREPQHRADHGRRSTQ